MPNRRDLPAVRRIVGVLSCMATQDRRAACEQTWVPLVERPDTIVVFLLGNPGLAVESKRTGRTLELRCGDSYHDLPEKTRRFAAWAVQSYQFDHLFKCDDDTHVDAASFHALDIDGADYVGAPVDPVYASGGCGYFLSRTAAELVAAGPLQHWAEDRAVGELLQANGIELTPNHRLTNCNPDWDGTPHTNAVTHHLQRMAADEMIRLHQTLARG